MSSGGVPTTIETLTGNQKKLPKVFHNQIHTKSSTYIGDRAQWPLSNSCRELRLGIRKVQDAGQCKVFQAFVDLHLPVVGATKKRTYGWTSFFIKRHDKITKVINRSTRTPSTYFYFKCRPVNGTMAQENKPCNRLLSSDKPVWEESPKLAKGAGALSLAG